LELANVDVTATVDGAGVTLSAQGNQRTLMWAEFSQIYESSRTLVLEKVEGDFLFLPKRAITLAQLAEFNHLAIGSTKNCKIKLSTRLA
jgi:YcxB-like protein